MVIQNDKDEGKYEELDCSQPEHQVDLHIAVDTESQRELGRENKLNAGIELSVYTLVKDESLRARSDVQPSGLCFLTSVDHREDPGSTASTRQDPTVAQNWAAVDTQCYPLRGKDLFLSGKAVFTQIWTRLLTGTVEQKWLVLAAAFVCQILSAGFGNSVAVFFVEFLETFHTGRAAVGWATSICSGLVFGAGMFVGILVHQFGPRVSTTLGGFLSFAGLLGCSLAPNIAVIFLTFGILTGTGCCLVCVASFVAVGQHFGKGRGAASSIAVAGSGTGALIFPIILRPLIDEYGWRGTMVILSALMLNNIPAAALFKTFHGKPESSKDEPEQLNLKEALCSPQLWKNPTYVCYIVICPIIAIGYKYTYIVIVDMGILKGFSKSDSTLLLVYISLAFTLSTVLFSFILKLYWSHSVMLFNICLVAMGAILFMFSALTSYKALVFGAVAYGSALGGISGLYAVITVDMLGLQRYSTGLGLVCTAYGIGYLLSAPMAGLINDLTGSYQLSFYIAGSLCLCGAAPFAIVSKLAAKRGKCKITPEAGRESCRIQRTISTVA